MRIFFMKGEVMKKILTKIIGASLAITMMIGVGVGVNANKIATEANADNTTITSAEVVSNSSYAKYETTNWIITFGGNNKSIGTNSSNRSKCNLSSCSKYAVSPVTTSSVASAFVSKVSLENIDGISYTFGGGSNQTSTNVYAIYSSNNTTFSQLTLTSGTQGHQISSPTKVEFATATGYFGLLFVATNSSGNWRIDDVNLTFYEHTENSGYTVTFNANNGTVPTAQNVANNATVERPADPTKRGYDFVNWYTDEGLSNIYDFDTQVTESFTLYAKWEKVNAAAEYSPTMANGDYRIIGEITAIIGSTDFMVQNGNNVMRVNSNPGTLVAGNSVDLFGTFSNSNGKISNLAYCDRTSEDTEISQIPLSDLVDISIANKFKYFAFDSIQLNSGFTSNSASIKNSELKLYYYSSTYVNVGGTFNAASFAANDYVAIKGVITEYNSNPQLQITFIEKLAQYTVTFVTGEGATAVPSQNVLVGQTVQQPDNPTKASDDQYNYSFGGWYDNEGCTGEPYDFSSPVNSSFPLYAKWNRTELTAAQATAFLNTTSSLTYHYSKEDGQLVADTLNNATTGITGTDYDNWTSTSNTIGISYKGQSAGGNESIQLRSNNSNSGVVVTANTNNRTIASITVKWESHSSDERIVDLYGKNVAYTAATQLYNNSNQGTKIASLACADKDENNEVTVAITGSYKFIGFRSRSGALYLESVTIQWQNAPTYTYSNVGVRFTGTISAALWERLDNESTILGYGIMYTTAEWADNAAIKEWYNMARDDEENVDDTFTAVQNKSYKMVKGTQIKSFYTAVPSDKAHPAQDGDNYGWSLFKNVSEAELATPFTAVAYIRTADNEIVFLNEITKSAAQLAQDLIDADNEYNATSLDGSLGDLASKA